MKKYIGIILGYFFLINPLFADDQFKLSPIFTEHMILQRELSNNIWGKASPGTEVYIQFNGKTAKAVADEQGVWKNQIAVGKAGGPFEFQAKAVSKTKKLKIIEFKDVYVGDVWLCTGQSNMEWEVKRFKPQDAERVTTLKNKLRLFRVTEQSQVLDEAVADTNREFQVRMPWGDATKERALEFSATGFHFGVDLVNKLDIPIGLISCAVGGSKIEAWMSRAELRKDPESQKNLDEFLKKAAKGKKPRWIAHWNSCLFSTMLYPISTYGIKGAIWYQGESDIDNHWLYANRFERMVNEWRALWGQGDFPFYAVQIASFDYARWKQAKYFDFIREQQVLGVKKLKNSGLALTVDLGAWNDIHPKRKREVGERLALIALNKTYGFKDVAYRGPEMKSVNFKGAKALVNFRFAKSLKIKGESLKAIQLADSDGRYFPAVATVKGNRLIVSSEAVKEPKFIRYGWDTNAKNHELNLYNESGLPALPFRTDTVEGPRK